MKLILITVCLLVSGYGAQQSAGPSDDLEKLQGSWAFVSLEVEGSKLPDAMLSGSKIIIKGENFKSISAGITYEGKIKIDRNSTPKTLDLIFTEGPEKGRTSTGIYELDGDNLKICLSLAGSTRPTEFASKPGSGFAFETLKREKQ
jgi:uncharacterized protein (TIGR03067 family)